jgi:hypothetical protein
VALSEAKGPDEGRRIRFTPDRFALDGFGFSGADLSIRSVPDAPNGLAFSSPALEIELPESASHVRVEAWVDQAITIEALDSSGTIIPTGYPPE